MKGPVGEALLNGVKMRCPRCGQGKLYARYLKLAPRCPACGTSFAMADVGDGAAVFVMFIVGALVVPFAFILQFKYALGIAATMIIAALAVTALSLALLPIVKATLFTLQWTHKAEEGKREE